MAEGTAALALAGGFCSLRGTGGAFSSGGLLQPWFVGWVWLLPEENHLGMPAVYNKPTTLTPVCAGLRLQRALASLLTRSPCSGPSSLLLRATQDGPHGR